MWLLHADHVCLHIRNGVAKGNVALFIIFTAKFSNPTTKTSYFSAKISDKGRELWNLVEYFHGYVSCMPKINILAVVSSKLLQI